MNIRSFSLSLVAVLVLGVICWRAMAATPAASAPAGAGDDKCMSCHEEEGTSKTFKSDIHFSKSLSCADCHGGNSKVDDMKAAKAPQSGFRVKMQRQDVPEFCAGCHSNAKFMATYNAKLATNQIALYARSAHGKALAAGNTKSAECVDCHGVHNIRPASDPQSSVNQRNLLAACIKCHPEEAALVRANRAHSNRTNCITCHTGGHNIQTATAELLTGATRGCGACHRGNAGAARTAAQMAAYLAELEKAGPESKEALARARRAVHSFNLGAMQRAAGGQGAPAAPAGPGGAGGAGGRGGRGGRGGPAVP